MESTSLETAVDRLKHEYVRLQNDINENDENIERTRRNKVDQQKTLNDLLQHRNTLALQVHQFAEQFADLFVDSQDCQESRAEMESLRNLCHTLTSLNESQMQNQTAGPSSCDLQLAESTTEICNSANACTSTAVTTIIVSEGGDEENVTSEAIRHSNAVRPKEEFAEFLGRMDSDSAIKDSNMQVDFRQTSRSKHSRGDLVEKKWRNRNEEKMSRSKAKTMLAAGQSKVQIKERNELSMSSESSATISKFMYALLFGLILSSLPLLFADTMWYKKLLHYVRKVPEARPRQPVSLSFLQRMRKLCRL